MQMKPWVIAVGILFILMCILLAIIVLLQQRGKGGMAGVFGGGGGGTGAEQIFGSSGVAPFMTKITAILGAVFLAFSLVLVLVVAPPSQRSGSGSTGGTQQGPPIPGYVSGGQEVTETQPTETEVPGETTGTEVPATDVRSLLFDTSGSGGE